MRRSNNSFWWAAVSICVIATIGGSSAFTIRPPSTRTTTTTSTFTPCPLLFRNIPRTSTQLDTNGIRSRYPRQPHHLNFARLHTNMNMNMYMTGCGGRGSSIGIGIQTAQLLLDKRRHAELKQNIRLDYPLVPDYVLDICIDIIARAFTCVAPEKILLALQQHEKIQQAITQPALKKALVRAALDQQVIRNLPVLKFKDKEALLGNVVDLCLRFLLRDYACAVLLAAPEVRLRALEEQVRIVKAQMGPWRLALYRLRNTKHPRLQVVTLILILSGILAYVQRDDPTVVTVTAIARQVFFQLVVPLFTLVQTISTIVQTEGWWMFHSFRSKVMTWL